MIHIGCETRGPGALATGPVIAPVLTASTLLLMPAASTYAVDVWLWLTEWLRADEARRDGSGGSAGSGSSGGVASSDRRQVAGTQRGHECDEAVWQYPGGCMLAGNEVGGLGGQSHPGSPGHREVTGRRGGYGFTMTTVFVMGGLWKPRGVYICRSGGCDDAMA